MRQYQWMYPFALVFLVLGGYGLKHSILGGLFLVVIGSIIYLYKWKLQCDAHPAISDEKLCPCGHIHKPRSDGRGLRTYCVEGSNCNSDKCKEFVSVATGEGGGK